MFNPRAWTQPPESPIGEVITGVDLQRFNPNKLQIQAKGPGLLVISEIDYPGWKVSVDGSPGQITAVVGLFRGVSLPGGEHKVILEFRPFLFTLGIGISGVAWVILIASFFIKSKRKA